MKSLAIISTVVLCLVGTAFGLNETEVREETCLSPPVDLSFNYTWTTTVPVWYTTLWSKGDIYGVAKILVGPSAFEGLTDEDLQNLCFYFRLTDDYFPNYGFGDRVFYNKLVPAPVRPGVWDLLIKLPDEREIYAATSYLVMTDNESFYATATYYADGLKGFSVASVEKTLPTETLNNIKERMEAIGFQKEFFYEVNYDNCAPPPSSI